MSLGLIPVDSEKNAFHSKTPAFRILCIESAFESSLAIARNFDALRVKITRAQFFGRISSSKILFPKNNFLSSKANPFAACIAFFVLAIVLAFDASAAPSAQNSVIAAPMASTPSINLIWNASPATNVTGYAVYYGPASRHYTSRIDVGSNLTCTVNGLASNQTYYFSVNAYDAAADESDFANEIAVSTTVTNAVIPVTTPSTNIVIVTIPMLSATGLSAPWQTEAVFTLAYTNPVGNKFFTAGTLSIIKTAAAPASTNIVMVTIPALSATNLSGPWQTEAAFTLNYTNPSGNKFFTPGQLSITNSIQ